MSPQGPIAPEGAGSSTPKHHPPGDARIGVPCWFIGFSPFPNPIGVDKKKGGVEGCSTFFFFSDEYGCN